MSKLSHAKIHFNDQGTPVAADFDDVYFSNDGGLAETDYVFLQHNGLPKRWQAHPRSAFHIIETGFGTGANFLLSWLRFRQFRAQHPKACCQRLYFSSVEKFPLSHADLTRALTVHSELSELCQQLLNAYPLAVSGCHRLSFDHGTVMLDLWFGDVSTVLPQLDTPADAIYLDGFAPSKNPDMWQDSLFSQLYRLSRPGTQLSTFTAAGLVKRGLLQAGFSVTKVKGFGRKREMLTACLSDTPTAVTAPEQSAPLDGAVTIIGGGIASLCSALALTQRGITVTLLCEDADVACQASQNRQGAVYPNLHANLTDDSQLHVQAFLYARRFYQHWQQQGLDFAMDWCGLLHIASNSQLQQRQHKLIANGFWPEQLVQQVDPHAATELAGLPLAQGGIYFPLAGWLNPQQFCRQALAYLTKLSHFSVQFNCKVSAIRKNDGLWHISSNQQAYQCSTLLLACGSALNQFAQTAGLALNKIRGQVSHVENTAMAPLKTVLCHKGYITPQWQGLHSVGATFDRQGTEAVVTEADNSENLALVQAQLHQPAWFAQSRVKSAAAAFRATLPDHLPVAGPVPEQPALYLLGGLGARGIMLSPLLAELIACQICAEPLPLSLTLRQKISASRF
ncbi:bifunctional tRNA (5-methylaminomethyl-2-thiouridine)(34)-methyltransferase MnmD/FAD-dependent 5-carboxymethylaminomethyl-2-thiouridine(34) oxidoreductase MnmC [Rheinheimera nanhaiensis]|uniref:tRNA 5-methylaminomethyl-2-thiouridine biosynthesis bifunctional protein MnmC n=1 Tax=Rheinheimera nanhaiensis E407-8 TaxID=562729 RepID=I1DZ56_9GAMM|nr:bifunctional tRNA (5-methylaminomethyl-2-thiouridine)(34)-methyltransferase MnmD/FAD-dependent 5-carboxymethylaminomethyl-2-thiouridine(34) oxidoreductase MnmC [Rheinheimera nanhaiensis]GAB59334.1 tRNA 5-methylaminomethyl-2-thiouridine biosynthesis bifunctional protein [Rheinheimera nanhaiensis E407-8]